MGLSSALSAHADDSLTKIEKSHRITLSYSYNDYPLSFSYKNKPTGMVVDLCLDVVHNLEKKLNIKHIDIDWEGEKQSVTLRQVKNHNIDMTCSAITATEERAKVFSFSNPYFFTGTAFLSRANESIMHEDNLRGKTIAVIMGDSTINRLNKLNKKLDYSLLMVTAPDYSAALSQFKSAKVKILATDEVLLEAFKASQPENYHVQRLDLGEMDTYGLVMSKESTQLTAAVNVVLDEILISNEYTELYNKWFMSPIPPTQQNLNMPMNKALQNYIKKALLQIRR